MISKILREVKSPFTDELIQDLIEKYINCGCNDNMFYGHINKFNRINAKSKYVEELIDRIWELSDITEDSENYIRTENNKNIYFDTDEYSQIWVYLFSEPRLKRVITNNSDEEMPLVYRIYLNILGKEKIEFIKKYIDICRVKNLEFQIKFSQDDSRLDQIILLSKLEDLEANIAIVEEISQGLNLGEIPMVVGKYKNRIGIAEEYYNRLLSPTQVRLILVRTSIKKYLCDHKNEFFDQLEKEEQEILQRILNTFINRFERNREYEDSNKRRDYYQRKSNIDCSKEYIDDNHEANCKKNELTGLNSAIKKYI